MEIRQLQSFVAIARLGGFRRAADELNISQAALSQQMKVLEAEAQVALFERGHRPLTLTEAGQVLLEHAERIVREATSAREDLQNFAALERGHIKIGTLPAHGASFAVPLIGAFHQAYANVAIEIVEYTTSQLFDLLQARAIDLACLNVPVGGWVPPQGVHFQPIEEFKLVFVVSPSHRLANATRVTLEDVADETLIMPPNGGSVSRMVEKAFQARDLVPKYGWHSSDRLTLLELAAAQFGVVVISRRAFDAHPELGLRALEPDGVDLRGCGGIAWTERGARTSVVTAMVRFAERWAGLKRNRSRS